MAIGDKVGKEAADKIVHEGIPAIDRTLDDFMVDLKGVVKEVIGLVSSIKKGKIHITITFDFPDDPS